MDEIPAFFEAVFTYKKATGLIDNWRDVSTETFYVFESSFGKFRLRKRYSFPATFAFVSGTKLHFGYGDRKLGQRVAFCDLTTHKDGVISNEEFLYGQADCKDRHVIIQRDAMSVLPIFAAHESHTLALSNHSERLPTFFDKSQLQINAPALINYLVFDDRYHNTIANIEPLHDRIRLEWKNNKYTILYPCDSLIASVQDGGASLRGFKEVLEKTLDMYWERYHNIGFQLSGGLDSATAPGYYAIRGKEVITATLGLPGVMGERQRTKLQAMVERFGMQRHIVDLDPVKHFPLADIATGRYKGLIYEFSDLFLIPTRDLADYYVSRGIETVFTGVGGDELCQNIPSSQILPEGKSIREKRLKTKLPNYFTKRFDELYRNVQENTPIKHSRPLPAIAYSVMLTNLGFNNMFVDRNVWPVAPLSDPKLFLYSQSIPAWHRYNKNPLRIYQFARGFPESIVHPTTLEDFSEFIYLCKPYMQPLFEKFFDTSTFARRGLIDAQTFSQHYHAVMQASFDPSDTRILTLIRLLILEINLHRLE